jgi:hypothetical protein
VGREGVLLLEGKHIVLSLDNNESLGPTTHYKTIELFDFLGNLKQYQIRTKANLEICITDKQQTYM